MVCEEMVVTCRCHDCDTSATHICTAGHQFGSQMLNMCGSCFIHRTWSTWERNQHREGYHLARPVRDRTLDWLESVDGAVRGGVDGATGDTPVARSRRLGLGLEEMLSGVVRAVQSSLFRRWKCGCELLL